MADLAAALAAEASAPRDALLERLHAPDPTVRRAAARELSRHADAAEALVARIDLELVDAVREAIFDSLLAIGGDRVADALLPLLRHPNAAVRNNALETLQALPDEVLARMDQLLEDPEPHVRIFAINILAGLEGVNAAPRLLQAIAAEQHVNVVSTALDHLVEIGTEDMIPALEALRERWRDERFVCFVIDTALGRLRSL